LAGLGTPTQRRRVFAAETQIDAQQLTAFCMMKGAPSDAVGNTRESAVLAVEIVGKRSHGVSQR
jgi:hypothetical protein